MAPDGTKEPHVKVPSWTLTSHETADFAGCNLKEKSALESVVSQRVPFLDAE